MKLINPVLHNALDYLAVVFLWVAPLILGLQGTIALLVYLLGLVHLVLTVLTDSPFGIIKVIPLKIHGHIELLVSVILLTTPLYLSNLTVLNSATEMFFFAGFGVVVFITWLISDYQVSTGII